MGIAQWSRSGVGVNLVAVALAGMLVCVPACNIVGPVVMLAQGPPTIDAQFELPEGKSLIFFIDDRGNSLPRRNLRQAIAERAQMTLLAEQPKRRVIDARAGMAVAARETASEPTDLVTLGRAVQADLVIYVTIDSFGLSPDGINYLPSSTMRIKVLDTTKDTDPRLWPAETEGFPHSVFPSQRAGVMPTSASERAKSELAFAGMIGESIAKVFFKHETREPINASGK